LSHANAVLTPIGRQILVSRVLSGRPQSHVARELGVSRQCVARWVLRFAREGRAGLEDRSSRPQASPNRTPPRVRDQVLTLRVAHRLGPPELARLTGVSAATVSRIISRAGLPKLFELDPVTGTQIRASRRTANRYEYGAPGDLVHIDVKKLGHIPDGGGWRGRGETSRNHSQSHRTQKRLGFDYVHGAVDDRSRLAYAEVLPDEKGETCAAFLERAARFYANHGITIRKVMSDNAWNYTRSAPFQAVLFRLSWRGWKLNIFSFARTVPGKTGKSNASTEQCKRAGLTPSPSQATRPERTPFSHGLITTTTLELTPHAEGSHQSVGCYQRHDRVHLGAGTSQNFWANDRPYFYFLRFLTKNCRAKLSHVGLWRSVFIQKAIDFLHSIGQLGVTEANDSGIWTQC